MQRYERQELYSNIGKLGQKQLQKATICIVGVGALGTVSSTLLARSGLNLILIDRDFIELNNLQRQLMFNESDIGKSKAYTAEEKLKQINSTIKIISHCTDLNYKNIELLAKGADIILGCTDNMESRFLINNYSLKHKIPWIYGGAVADKGLLYNILPKDKKRACFRCIIKGSSGETCDTAGILNANSAIIGSMMANEAIKIILDLPEQSLIHMNLWDNTHEKISVPKTKGCKACSGNYEYLSGDIYTKHAKLCGKGTYQIYGKKQDLTELKKKLSKLDKVIMFKDILHFKELTIFSDGRVFIKSESEPIAKSLYSKYVGN